MQHNVQPPDSHCSIVSRDPQNGQRTGFARSLISLLLPGQPAVSCNINQLGGQIDLV
jgi:hypothetical protein